MTLPVVTGSRAAEATDLYLDGWSLKRIANRLRVCTAAVASALRRQGVLIRSAGKPRRYSLDEAAFEAAEPGEEALYFAGLLFADGCVRQKSDRGYSGAWYTTLSLQKRDRAIVERFRAFLKSDHPIHDRVPQTSKSGVNSAGACMLSICSARLAKSLVRFGVIPRKTYTASVPEWLRTNRHFWRGVVDGDGWITFRKRPLGKAEPKIGLCGTWEVVEQFREWVVSFTPTRMKPVPHPVSQHCWRFVVAVNKAADVARRLYSGCTVALPRKLALAEQLFAHDPWWAKPKRDHKANGRRRSDNRKMTVNGETLCVTEWAERAGLKANTIFKRLDRGWSAEAALRPAGP